MNHQQFQRPAGKPIRLSDCDPSDTRPFADEAAAQACLRKASQEITRGHDLLMAHEKHGLLILFQGMDAAGKDEAIRDVLRVLDPRGCEFKQFKRMSEKEARHDFLWRAMAAVPARGQIGIFNRSYYEQVIVERVHPELLEPQKLPQEEGPELWAQRFRHIQRWEEYLTENGIHVLKFFLHVSRDEQCQRLLERIRNRETAWEFSSHDVDEREHWDTYMRVYEEALTATNTPHAPWYVLPGDHRWYSQAVIASVLQNKLASFHQDYPTLDEDTCAEINRAEKELEKQLSCPPRQPA